MILRQAHYPAITDGAVVVPAIAPLARITMAIAVIYPRNWRQGTVVAVKRWSL
jgi:hypothetical protein